MGTRRDENFSLFSASFSSSSSLWLPFCHEIQSTNVVNVRETCFNGAINSIQRLTCDGSDTPIIILIIDKLHDLFNLTITRQFKWLLFQLQIELLSRRMLIKRPTSIQRASCIHKTFHRLKKLLNAYKKILKDGLNEIGITWKFNWGYVYRSIKWRLSTYTSKFNLK